MASISPLLGIGIATAGIPDAIGKGIDLKQARDERRVQALQRKKEGDLRLQTLQHTVDQQPLQDQVLQDQVQSAHIKLQELQSTITKQDTYKALNNFFDSGDPRSLNQFFHDYKDNPQVQAMFNGVIKVDPIDKANPEDQRLLTDAGLTSAELDAADGKKDGKIDWTKLNKRFVKVVNSKGETKITDMLHVAAATGYARYASDQSLKKMKALADIQRVQNSGLTTNQKDAAALAKAKGTTPGAELQSIVKGKARHDPNNTLTGTEKEAAVIAKANGTTMADELIKLKAKSATHDPNNTLTSFQKNARAVAAATERLANGTSTNKALDKRLVAQGQETLGGVGGGKQVIAETARTQLKALNFDKMSQKEMHSNSAVRNAINRIEEAHPISEAQQKQLIDLNSLVALSGPASQLSSSQTGLLDSMTSSAKRYVSNDVTDQQTKSAYEALIGTFRHDLLGAAMSDSELALFTKAYNTDKQKIGPVLSGLKAALIQVKSKLSTISDLNDPSVIKFRTGKSIEDISSSIIGIDKRISFLNKVAAGVIPLEAKRQVDVEYNAKAPVDIDKALGF